MKTGWTRSRRGGAGCLGWFLLIALVAAVIAWTHGLILIPVIIAGAVLAIRRGKISKTPGLAIAVVLVALTATVAGLTFAGGSHASASQPPTPAASTQAPDTHAPAAHTPVPRSPTRRLRRPPRRLRLLHRHLRPALPSPTAATATSLVSTVATQITVCTVWLETAKGSPVRTTTAGDGNRSKHHILRPGHRFRSLSGHLMNSGHPNS